MNEKFFINSMCDSVGGDFTIPNYAHRTGKEIPKWDNILVFRSIVSQNYKTGESSRNRYKYDQNGWDFSDYNHNPIIAWQHDYDYGAIGHAIAFWHDGENNLNSLFYVDLDTLEPRHAKQIKNGYTAGVSTGASTEEYMFEDNKNGDRYSREDAEEKFGWENVMNAFFGASSVLTLVITKAKLLENSLVTIGSNAKAVALQNSISDYFGRIAEDYKTLHSNKNFMKNQDTKTPETTTESPVTETPETDTNSVEVLQNEVKNLQNQIEELKKNHQEEINKIRDEEKAKFDSLLIEETNKIRTEEKENLAKIVAEQNNTTGEVNSVEDFRKKYLQK